VRYRFGADQYVTAAALAPDGKTLAMATSFEVTVWNLDSGRCVTRFESVESPSRVSFTADGKYLIGMNNVRLWVVDRVTGKERLTWDFREHAGPFVVFPNSIRFAIFEGGTGYVFDTGRWEFEEGLLEPDYSIAAVGPSGRYYIARADDVAQLVDVSTGRLRCRFPRTAELGDHKSALTPDDGRFCILTTDGRLRVFDAITGKELEHLDPPAEWHDAHGSIQLTLSPDGTVAYFSQSNQRIHRRHLVDRKWLEPLVDVPDGPILAHPDGNRLIVPGNDGIIHRFDLRSLQEIRDVDGFDEAPLLAPSPDGRRVAIASGWRKGRADLFELDGQKLWSVSLRGWSGPPRWSPDGRLLAFAGEREAVLCAADSGKVLHRLQSPEGDGQFNGLLGFAADGKRLLASLDNGEAMAEFDVESGRLLQSLPIGLQWATDISTDGHTLAFSNGGPSVALFDLEAWRIKSGFLFPPPPRRGCGGGGFIRHTSRSCRFFG
jgi:WD40 repeat protein